MSLNDLKISVNDVVKFSIYFLPSVIFVVSMNNKVDTLTDAVNELKSGNKEYSADAKITNQNLQNQVNANSLQIKLMAQDIEMIKQGYYPQTK